jgi:hypothetical protein
MAAKLTVPVSNLRDVVTANAHLLEVAKSLTTLAEETKDPAVETILTEQIGRILKSFDTIGAAIMSSEPPRAG